VTKGSTARGARPKTVEEAIELLRTVADKRDRWADEQAQRSGEQAVTWARQEALHLRTAANLIEDGDSGWLAYTEKSGQ
jgi:hypothetical protein